MNLECKIHKDEIITNFCCVRSCLMPLCPECIDEHNKFHQNERTVPEIDTLRRVQMMSRNKLDAITLNLEEAMQKLNSATNIDIEKSVQKSLAELESLRKRLIEQINTYISALQEDYIAKSRAAISQIPDFRELKSKISGLSEEVSQIRSNLESPHTFDAIKCTINLDQDTLQNNVNNWIDEAIKTVIKLPTHLVFDKDYKNEFQEQLKTIVTIDHKEVQLITNEKQLSTRFPGREDKQQGLVRSYFESKFRDS